MVVGNSVNPVEPVSGKSGINRALPFLETPSVRLQRQPDDTRPIEEAKESRDARGGAPRDKRHQSGSPTPKDRVEVSTDLTRTYLRFAYDEEAQIVQAKVVEYGSNRVIRESPPKALVELSKSLRAYQEAGRAARAFGRPDQAEGQNVPDKEARKNE
jgi:uncharacterized FlaG/YvyC family protein